MKQLILSFLLLPGFLFAQFNEYPREGEGQVSGGLGLNWINSQPYYTLHFTPEASIADFGVGLDLRLDFDSHANLRKENFNELSDYLSVIRYARYGLKNDPVYVKLGALDYYTLGHGSIMYLYNNSPSIDSRKIGLVTDINFGVLGFESIYSRFAEAGVVGLRGYVRLLQFTSAYDIPVIGNLEIGLSYAGDYDKYAGIISGYYDQSKNEFVTLSNKGFINIFGVDIGFPLFRSGMFSSTLYTDFSKIIDFGSGVAVGLITNYNSLGLITASAKLERRFNNSKYIPSYFNSLYEVERFEVNKSTGSFISKAALLNSITNPDNGYFGKLNLNFISLFTLMGSYERLDKTPNSGVLHLETEIAPENSPFIIKAGYDKINLGAHSSIFKVDENSYLYSELGYKLLPYVIVGIDYIWTFTPVRNSNDDIIGYEPQKRIGASISFVYPLSFTP
jgi:hypothetical protein